MKYDGSFNGRKVRLVPAREPGLCRGCVVIDAAGSSCPFQPIPCDVESIFAYCDDEDLNMKASVVVINALAKQFHDCASSKGFHDIPTAVDTLCANLHGEVSELWEAYRKGTLNATCDKATTEPLTNAEEELADIFIRVLDTAGELKIDIGRAVSIKSAYNKTRPRMHGKIA